MLTTTTTLITDITPPHLPVDLWQGFRNPEHPGHSQLGGGVHNQNTDIQRSVDLEFSVPWNHFLEQSFNFS